MTRRFLAAATYQRVVRHIVAAVQDDVRDAIGPGAVTLLPLRFR